MHGSGIILWTDYVPKSLIGVQILSCEWSCSDESTVFNLWLLQDVRRALRTMNEIEFH